MKNKKEFNRSGSTLLELTIAMALMDIVIVLVISFVAVIEGIAIRTSYEVDVQEDYDIVEHVLHTWLASFDTEEFYIYVSDDGEKLYAKRYLESNDFQFRYFKEFETILYNTCNREKDGHRDFGFYGLERTDKITFKLINNENNGNILIVCDIDFTKMPQVKGSPYHKTLTLCTLAMKYGGEL